MLFWLVGLPDAIAINTHKRMERDGSCMTTQRKDDTLGWCCDEENSMWTSLDTNTRGRVEPCSQTCLVNCDLRYLVTFNALPQITTCTVVILQVQTLCTILDGEKRRSCLTLLCAHGKTPTTIGRSSQPSLAGTSRAVTSTLALEK